MTEAKPEPMIIGLCYRDESLGCYAIMQISETEVLKTLHTEETPPCGALEGDTFLVLVVNSDYSYMPIGKLKVASLHETDLLDLGIEIQGETGVVSGPDAPDAVKRAVMSTTDAVASMTRDPATVRDTYVALERRIREAMVKRASQSKHTIH